MSVALLVTVDVEEDMPRWVPEPQVTVHNIVALPRLRRLCDEFGLQPTYLTTYQVAADRLGRESWTDHHQADEEAEDTDEQD